MHSQGNYKQGEKITFKMGENNSKQNNGQIINLQNIQAVHAAQYQKNKPKQKVGQRTKQTFLQKRHTYGKKQTNKHMNRCSKLLIIGEMQTKTTMRYHLTWVRMATIKKSTNNAGEGMEKRELSYIVGANVN